MAREANRVLAAAASENSALRQEGRRVIAAAEGAAQVASATAEAERATAEAAKGERDSILQQG